MKIQDMSPLLPNVEERYRLLVDSIIDYAVYMLDPDGIVASWNSGAQRFKGYASEEIIGLPFSLFYTEEDRLAGLPKRGLEIAAAQGRFETEGWRVRNDGSRFWAHVIIDPIRDEVGSITGFAKVTRDITERYQTQQELDRAREALFQARKMEAVGRLTGGVAHDFNNLLTIVLISLNLAKKRAPDSPVLDLIDNAIQGAERGAAMTQRMLAFSRHQPLKIETLVIADLLQGIQGLIRQSIGPVMRIHTRIASALPRIHGDRNQLETALLNLVINARDAMPGGGEVLISARLPTAFDSVEAVMEPNEYVLLEVVDTGDGMDEETARRAIEPFFTTKDVGKGTGLGLSMAHGIVEQLGGKLMLESVLGKGTTVQLWLPISHELTVQAGPSSIAQCASATKPLQILVVDDDDLVLTNTCALLEDMGHHTFQASSADVALEMLKNLEVALVITDHAMPNTTGRQLVESLKVSNPKLPVIIASGYSDITERADPGIPTLAKPFDEAGLSRVICQAMEKATTLVSRGVIP
ncbi:ATP-binding response regulator [Halopseudomonas salina]|uniref:histidine kinase n=1 Tax=Halopseudomonas salina TaxID=1323744 RepID=A0ABQ1PSB7_9GAMM|nr:PAS domain-containing sensor histidine kinase [Halopseudomonas salina]GGD02461.1 histidine kinase [Halopseudomonas salina]